MLSNNLKRFCKLPILIALTLLIFLTEYSKADELGFYDLKAKNLAGEEIDFKSFRDHVVLITNIATGCGTTPQLKELESLYQLFSSEKFIILGFPSNDFNPLELQDSHKIKQVCYQQYGITFPIMEIVELKGINQHSVFSYLTSSKNNQIAGPVMFNFEKFLISPQGKLTERYGSFTSPLSKRMIKDINQLITSVND